LFIEHRLHRGAYRLIRSVNTTQPAAGPTHPFFELNDRPFNVILSRLGFFDEGNPAYPLIARKRRKIFPYCQCRSIGSEGVS
jgi:hypothetical protein